MIKTPSRFSSIAAAALLAAGILAGCATTPPDLQPGAAEKLNARLQTVAQAAADNNPAAAKAELDLLASDVSAAAANGDISPARRQDIQAAIALVNADLAAMTPTPSPAPTLQTPAPAAPKPPAKGKGKGKDD